MLSPTDYQLQFAQRLKKSRIAAGFSSAADLAAALGLDAPTYRSYESANPKQVRAFPLHLMPLLCALLREDSWYLISGQRTTHPKRAPAARPGSAAPKRQA